MNEGNIVTVPSDLWPVADLFFQGLGDEVNLNDESEVGMLFRGFFLLYITIVILAIITYKLGFSRKLPPLKAAVVYGVLIIGTFILTLILGLNLPIAESLFVSSVILGIYRYRLYKERGGRERRT
ncbi:YlaH-like family protein [Thalassobacillus sp. CUG 92003]|uniref:YlaH-like family protein n=1 Tax=Thalassobacillus sp. CUG 92003 TaxID=2736641 RepID=UPI0015E6888F|nr:YlaH-like family protein [Thalassobacillus sp. CUG 92003]